MKRPTPKEIATFTAPELHAMHRYCLDYCELVQKGKTPTLEQDARFMQYHVVTNKAGVTHD